MKNILIEHMGGTSLKTNKIFIFFISMFLVLITGCANGISNERNKINNQGDKIIVEKRVGEADKYEYYSEIKDSKEVENVKDVLNNITWENAAVSMAYPPHYKFYFEDTNSKSSGVIYELWISPDKGRTELVVDSASEYVHLNKEVSKKLFKIITGKELDEAK
jgi:hypothetical protein